jgi:hypothetical protein
MCTQVLNRFVLVSIAEAVITLEETVGGTTSIAILIYFANPTILQFILTYSFMQLIFNKSGSSNILLQVKEPASHNFFCQQSPSTIVSSSQPHLHTSA